jgi:glucuronosyltransferase
MRNNLKYIDKNFIEHENTKLFITHGGLMGIQESIYFAVPMISIPLFGDQPVNADLIVEKGISKIIQLNNITEEGLTSAIKDILYNPVYK